MTDRDASVYLCRPREAEEERELVDTGAESRYRTYFSMLFRFKVGAGEGGVLGLLWIREDEFWRIVTYEAFEP